MKRTTAVLVAAFGLALCANTDGLAQYLTGSAREDFIKGTAGGCIRAKAKSNDPTVNLVPNSLYEGYCRCYATMLADKLKIADIEADNTSVTAPIVKAAGTNCYQAMKAGALRLYNAGQYPKQ
jgi:hypothetical protein